VALLEADSLSEARGSSAGSARIFAPFPFPDREHLAMALRALDRWREIEREAGERLLTRTGALSRGEAAERALPALRDAGVEAELIGADGASELGVRMPADGTLLHQHDAGTIHADRARAALLRLAASAGASLHGGERARTVAATGDAVEVETDRRRWRSESAIVAAGPWSKGLLARSEIDLDATPTGQTVAYFDLEPPSARPPAVIEYDGDEPYACWDPDHGLKAGLHVRGAEVEPERASPKVDQGAVERIAAWVEMRFPAASNTATAVEACMYTSSADERFILEARDRTVVACPCNGQGFQFAPETGARLAELAVGDGALSGSRG
jgi:sarcosine oxidase